MNNLTFENVTIDDNGFHGIEIVDPAGTTTIANSDLDNSFTTNLKVSASSGTAGLLVTNSTIHLTQLCVGDPGIDIATTGTANLTTTFMGNTISDHEGDGLNASAGGSSMLGLTVSGGNTFNSNWNGLTLGVDGSASTTFDIAGNTFSNTSGNGIEILALSANLGETRNE